MNMKRKFKRIFSLVLASVMVLSLAACGKSGKEQTGSDNTEKKDFVWVPEFKDLGGDLSFYNAKMKDGFLYYEKNEWDETTQENSYSIESLSLMDGQTGESIPLEPAVKEGENAHRNISAFVPTEDGVTTLETVYHWDEENGGSKSEHYICKYDKSGARTEEKDITEALSKDENNSYVSAMEMDAEGRMYLVADTVIHLLDAEGNYHGLVKADQDSWVTAIGAGKNGKMYASFYKSGGGMLLKEIDYEGKAFGASYDNLSNGYGNNRFTAGLNKDFLTMGNDCLYEYDLESQSAEEVLNWLDCDINGNNLEAVYALEDGRIACISSDWQENKGELAILTKKPASEVKEKITITIGGLYTDYSVLNEAVKFNKSNDTYRISMETYFDYNDVVVNGTESNYDQLMQDAVTRLNNDITSDKCPDMLMLSNIDVERFAAKGVFEDLNIWLEKSTKVNKEDYFENILEAYTYDGVLVSIPKSFELLTLVGKASDLGTEPGWTVEEMIEYSRQHPDAEVISYLSKDSALDIMLQYNQGSYVDWETGQCDFNNDSFISLLEFAKQFPDEYAYNTEENISEATKIGNGQLLLSQTYIYDFQSIQMPAAIFNNDVCFIGFPNESGNSGTYLQAGTGVAMTAKSDCKEGAWEFFENYLTSTGNEYSSGFSSKKDEFAKAKEEALKVEYLKDENGENLLDENGEPIPANGGGMISYGDDWEYTYHITTQEEADLLEELIRIAKPASVADATVLNIVKEEAGAFFSGQRSAQDVAGIIQSRVQVYVNENR